MVRSLSVLLLVVNTLTLKAPSKICSRQHSKFFLYFSEKTNLDISCESSAKSMIHMKCQDLFSLKKKKKKKKKKKLFAAVVIGALRVNIYSFCLIRQYYRHVSCTPDINIITLSIGTDRPFQTV